MSASSEQTASIAVFAPRKILWALPVVVCLQFGLDLWILRAQDWWLFGNDVPFLSAANALALVLVRLWVITRVLSSLSLAPTLTVQRDTLSVHVSGATRTVLWTDIRGWSLANGGPISLSLAKERLQIQANTLRDLRTLVTTMTRHIGQPTLERGITSELARRVDAGLICCLIVLQAMRTHEHWTFFALTLSGLIACLAIGAALHRATIADWARSWELGFLGALIVASSTLWQRYQPSASSAAVLGALAGVLLIVATFALGIVPRVQREATA